LALALGGSPLFAQAQGDVVFVIDESHSMEPDIADVKANVGTIVGALSSAGIDFRLGLVGFGGSGVANPRLLTHLTADVPTFRLALDQLVGWGGNEPGFKAVSLAMSSAMEPFRPDAGVCAILISDEPSEGSYTADKPQAILDLKNRGAVFLGIVDTTPSPWETTAYDYGPNPGSLAAETGGRVFDIYAFKLDPTTVIRAVLQECIEEIVGVFPLDIKPQSCPNPLNVSSRGVLPVAILGTAQLDVTLIDPSSLRLANDCPAVRWDYEDVATPYDGEFGEPPDAHACTTAGPDGHLDLTVKFATECVAEALAAAGDGDTVVVPIEGEKTDGAAVESHDVVIILKNKKK
jgi:hypothetical protein